MSHRKNCAPLCEPIATMQQRQRHSWLHFRALTNFAEKPKTCRYKLVVNIWTRVSRVFFDYGKRGPLHAAWLTVTLKTNLLWDVTDCRVLKPWRRNVGGGVNPVGDSPAGDETQCKKGAPARRGLMG